MPASPKPDPVDFVFARLNPLERKIALKLMRGDPALSTADASAQAKAAYEEHEAKPRRKAARKSVSRD